MTESLRDVPEPPTEWRKGCYRCELNLDELETQREKATRRSGLEWVRTLRRRLYPLKEGEK